MARHYARWFQFSVLDLLILTAIAATVAMMSRSSPMAFHEDPSSQLSDEDVHDAASDGDVRAIKRILTRYPLAISRRNDSSQTPLHLAVSGGHTESVKYLLAAGADVNAMNDQCTPLHMAHDTAVVEALLGAKPDLNVRDGVYHQTPLESAAAELVRLSRYADATAVIPKWQRIIKLLRDAGADYDVHSAIYLDDIQRVRDLLQKDSTLVTMRHGASMLPLRRAARGGHTEICKLLLEFGADPNSIDESNGYPVLQAAIPHAAIVKLLLAAGAKINMEITESIIGRCGAPPAIGDRASLLHFAAEEGAVESMKLLLGAGANANARDSKGQTPLHVAALCGNAEMIDPLLGHGADIDAKDAWGRTPLRLADTRFAGGAVEALRRRGAHLDAMDRDVERAPPRRSPRVAEAEIQAPGSPRIQ